MLPGLTIEFLLWGTPCWASNDAQQVQGNSGCLCWHSDQSSMLGAEECWDLIFNSESGTSIAHTQGQINSSKDSEFPFMKAY